MRRKNPNLRRKPTLAQVRIALLCTLTPLPGGDQATIGLRCPQLNGSHHYWLEKEPEGVFVRCYGRGQGWSDQSSETCYPPNWEGIEEASILLMSEWSDIGTLGLNHEWLEDPRLLPPPDRVKKALAMLPPPPPRLRSLKPYLP